MGVPGKLKITVVKGCNLTVKDFRSSDPYVVLCLGNQRRKTSVKWRNLNPVWNEEVVFEGPFMSSPTLSVEVWDKDRFTRDDFMGSARVDLSKLLAATTTANVTLGVVEDVVKLRLNPRRERCKWAGRDLGSLYLHLHYCPNS